MKHATQRLASLTVAVLMFIAALFVFFNLVKPAYQESQKLKGEKVSKENVLKNQKATVEQVRAIVASYKGNGSLQSLTASALPPVRDEANLVNQLNVVAAKYGVSIQNLTIAAPAVRGTGTAGKGKASSTVAIVRPIGVLTAQMRVTATYASFKLFLQSLESNIRLTDVTALAATPVGKPNQDYYAFDLALAAYYQNP